LFKNHQTYRFSRCFGTATGLFPKVVEELDSMDLIKLLMKHLDFGKVRKKKKLFIFAWPTSIIPDIDNSIYCPWLQPGDYRK